MKPSARKNDRRGLDACPIYSDIAEVITLEAEAGKGFARQELSEELSEDAGDGGKIQIASSRLRGTRFL